MVQIDISKRPVFKANKEFLNNGCEYLIQQGGTSSGKTYQNLEFLLFISKQLKPLENESKPIISIVSDSLKNLKKDAIRHFETILRTWRLKYTLNKSETIYEVNGCIFEFFGTSTTSKYESKGLGAKRNVLYIVDASKTPFPNISQLLIRTYTFTLICFNPSGRFWVFPEFIENETYKSKVGVNVTTYLDNKFLTAEAIRKIEFFKPVYNKKGELIHGDLNYWRVYGEGKLGENVGRIFTNVHFANEIPKTAKFLGYGVDYGFSNSYTAVIAMWIFEKNTLFLKEIIYEKGLTVLDIKNTPNLRSLKGLLEQKKVPKNALIVADSNNAEANYAMTMEGYPNWTIARKNNGSVMFGIDLLRRYKLFLISDKNEKTDGLKSDFLNYSWAKDNFGMPLNEPEDAFKHSPDAAGYLLKHIFLYKQQLLK